MRKWFSGKEHMLCKHKDLSFNALHSHKNLTQPRRPIIQYYGVETGSSLNSLLAEAASDSVGDPVSKIKVAEDM